MADKLAFREAGSFGMVFENGNGGLIKAYYPKPNANAKINSEITKSEEVAKILSNNNLKMEKINDLHKNRIHREKLGNYYRSQLNKYPNKLTLKAVKMKDNGLDIFNYVSKLYENRDEYLKKWSIEKILKQIYKLFHDLFLIREMGMLLGDVKGENITISLDDCTMRFIDYDFFGDILDVYLKYIERSGNNASLYHNPPEYFLLQDYHLPGIESANATSRFKNLKQFYIIKEYTLEQLQEDIKTANDINDNTIQTMDPYQIARYIDNYGLAVDLLYLLSYLYPDEIKIEGHPLYKTRLLLERTCDFNILERPINPHEEMYTIYKGYIASHHKTGGRRTRRHKAHRTRRQKTRSKN